MVSNLLVVLCGERGAQPVVNTGTHLSVEADAMAEAQDRSCCGSIPPVLEAMQRWANDDLRSLNGQIEFLLRRALAQAGRTPSRSPSARA